MIFWPARVFGPAFFSFLLVVDQLGLLAVHL